MEYEQTTELEDVIGKLDVLYMTRVQGERFASEEEYLKLRDRYILTVEKMAMAKDDMIVLHPLPRVNEISVKVDEDKRACYFKQVLNGKYMRMALILYLLSLADGKREELDLSDCVIDELKCTNRRCITKTEQELAQIFRITDKAKGVCRCIYCESKQIR